VRLVYLYPFTQVKTSNFGFQRVGEIKYQINFWQVFVPDEQEF